MENPFDIIVQRLDSIEKLLNELSKNANNSKPPKDKHQNFACIKDEATKIIIKDLSAFFVFENGLKNIKNTLPHHWKSLCKGGGGTVRRYF